MLCSKRSPLTLRFAGTPGRAGSHRPQLQRVVLAGFAGLVRLLFFESVLTQGSPLLLLACVKVPGICAYVRQGLESLQGPDSTMLGPSDSEVHLVLDCGADLYADANDGDPPQRRQSVRPRCWRGGHRSGGCKPSRTRSQQPSLSSYVCGYLSLQLLLSIIQAVTPFDMQEYIQPSVPRDLLVHCTADLVALKVFLPTARVACLPQTARQRAMLS